MLVKDGRNSATPAQAASFVAEINRLEIQREERLAELDAEFKAKKREVNKWINDDQGSIFDDAKSQGVAKGVIRAMIAEQKDLRKARRIQERAGERTDDLEDDDLSYVKSIRDALGEDFIDLPLGAAAAAREEGGEQDETTAAIIGAVQRDEAAKAAGESF